jgi:hypothetical protein
MELNYEEDLHIDEKQLDIEILEQTDKAIRYAKNWVECKRRFMQAEEKVKVIRSLLIKRAHEKPDTCLGYNVKPTAMTVEAYYRTNQKYIAAKEKLVQAQYELDLAEIAKNEMCYTRKTMLENLVKLNGQQYFAGPVVPRNLEQERKTWDQIKNQTKEMNKKSLRRRRSI